MTDGAYFAAAVQFEPALFDKTGNVDKLLSLVREAAESGAALIATPEMATTGYCFFDESEAAAMAEPVPGPTTDRFADLARETGCHVVVGMPERVPESGLLYNSAVLIGPQGIVGVHRKSHSYIAEPKWAAPGNLGHQVFDTPLGKIALLICMDIHFVETARIQALAEADIICHISAWLAERTPAPYWISRAFENSVYLIESNRWGLERGVQFSGGSCIIDPDGSVLASRDAGDGIVRATIDPKRSRSLRAALDAPVRRRRPELYRELQRNTYLWNPTSFFTLYGNQPLPPGKESIVAVAQVQPTRDIDHNLRLIKESTDQLVGERGAELVVFPELSLTGPLGDNGESEAIELSLAGAIGELVSAAQAWSAYLVVGLAERVERSDRPYNTIVLVGPEGIVAAHRKIHLPPDEHSWFDAGSTWTVANTLLGRIGLLHGDDLLLPESARVLALRGCDIIAAPADLDLRLVSSHEGTRTPHNFPIATGATLTHWHHMRVRAGENNVFLAFANTPADGDHGGMSGIFGPDTFAFPRTERVLGRDERVAWMTVDTSGGSSPYPTTVVRRKDLVSMRLPHHYASLSAPDPALRNPRADTERALRERAESTLT